MLKLYNGLYNNLYSKTEKSESTATFRVKSESRTKSESTAETTLVSDYFAETVLLSDFFAETVYCTWGACRNISSQTCNTMRYRTVVVDNSRRAVLVLVLQYTTGTVPSIPVSFLSFDASVRTAQLLLYLQKLFDLYACFDTKSLCH